MIALTKEEIAKYLRDYSIISKLIVKYPNNSIKEIFSNFMIKENRFNDNNEEYYETMINVYTLFTILKSFSFSEDYLVNNKLILNEELNFDDIKEKIFLNANDAKYFNSKRNIITYIRNAFNHSDNNKQLYSISKNGRYLAINLENPKEKHPLHLKLNMEQLLKLHKAMLDAKRTLFIITFDINETFNINSNNLYQELDKIKFNYINFTKKISKETLENINNILSRKITTKEQRDKKSNDLKEALQNETYTTQSYSLTHEQKTKFINELQRIKNLINYKLIQNVPNINEEPNYYIYYILPKCIPLGSTKYQQTMLEYHIAEYYLRNYNNSYNYILENIGHVYFNRENINSDEYNSQINKIMRDYYNTPTLKLNLVLDIIDIYSKEIYPLLIYIGYITDTIYNEEFIQLKNNTYLKERIRNSFVHGRFFYGLNSKLELYDGPSGNNNYYNFDWHETLNIEELKKWTDEIYNQQFSNSNDNILKKKKEY